MLALLLAAKNLEDAEAAKHPAEFRSPSKRKARKGTRRFAERTEQIASLLDAQRAAKEKAEAERAQSPVFGIADSLFSLGDDFHRDLQRLEAAERRACVEEKRDRLLWFRVQRGVKSNPFSISGPHARKPGDPISATERWWHVRLLCTVKSAVDAMLRERRERAAREEAAQLYPPERYRQASKRGRSRRRSAEDEEEDPEAAAARARALIGLRESDPTLWDLLRLLEENEAELELFELRRLASGEEGGPESGTCRLRPTGEGRVGARKRRRAARLAEGRRLRAEQRAREAAERDRMAREDAEGQAARQAERTGAPGDSEEERRRRMAELMDAHLRRA
eukprot:tig00000157_g9673.t1